MYLSQKWKTGYLATPKCASRTVARLLCKNGFTEQCGHHGMSNFENLEEWQWLMVVRNPFSRAVSYFNHKKQSCLSLVEEYGIDEWWRDRPNPGPGETPADYRRFLAMSFSEWLDHSHPGILPAARLHRPHVMYREVTKHVSKPVYLLRVEQLDHDLRHIPNTGLALAVSKCLPSPRNGQKLPVEGVPSSGEHVGDIPWQDFYQPGDAERVLVKYAKDFDAFAHVYTKSLDDAVTGRLIGDV